MLKVRGLSIESCCSIYNCIDLSMHVHVYSKILSAINLYNHSIIYNYVYTMQELGNEAK